MVFNLAYRILAAHPYTIPAFPISTIAATVGHLPQITVCTRHHIRSASDDPHANERCGTLQLLTLP